MLFNEYGLLNPGDYEVTFKELRQSILVKGPSSEPDWDKDWRSYLVGNLEIMVKQLWTVGINDIFIDGSFVENKIHPNDIDGYFVVDLQQFISGDLERNLNKLDPYKIWTWSATSRRPYKNQTKKQLPMWHRYRVELYPHFGQPSGIKDEFGNDQMFPAAFRKTRNSFYQKGIIKIIR